MNKEHKILKAALESFVNKGFHGTSTASIAEKAGVSNGTLFHYYKTKDILIQKLHETIKSEEIEYISNGLADENDPKSQIYLIWKNTLDWSMKNNDKQSFLYQYKFSPYKKKDKSDVNDFKKKFEAIVEEGVQQKQLRYMPSDLIFELINGYISGLTEYLVLNPVKYRTPEFMKQAYNMFWSAIKA